jgi:hypothetical protein
MKFIGLVFKSARRSKRRTLLTIISVALAVFLFATLRSVLDGFDAVSAASSSTRIVTIRSTSMIFPMPTSHAEAIRSTPGIRDVTWANWFGGIYKEPKNFFGQFAIEPESYLRMYPEVILSPEDKKAFLEDRTGCIVGDGLAKKYAWKVGDRIVIQPGIPNYGSQDYPFTIRGIYKAGSSAIDNQSMLFHWKYVGRAKRRERAGRVGRRGGREPRSGRAGGDGHRSEVRQFALRNQDRHRAAVLRVVRVDAPQPEPALGSVALAVVLDPVRRRQHDGDVGAGSDHRDRQMPLGFRSTVFLLVVGEGWSSR